LRYVNYNLLGLVNIFVCILIIIIIMTLWSFLQIYRNKIFRVFENPSDSLGDIRDQDKVVAYRMPKDTETTPLVVFVHERSVEK